MDLNNARRFWAKTQATDDGCIVWIGGIRKDGYGQFYHSDTSSLAHRWAYELMRGPVPPGLELDHLCRVRRCVNVDHLEAVTRQVNATRGVGFAGQNARKAHCPKGHPYDGGNLYVNPAGSRVCRTCNVIKARAYRERKKAAS